MLAVCIVLTGLYLMIGIIVAACDYIDTDIATCDRKQPDRDYHRVLAVKRIPKNIFGWIFYARHRVNIMFQNARVFEANKEND